ncbi:MAG TPA: hypothetical protein VGK25_02750 [Ignavibacteria bacterium]|jgi:hypothetical protein
MNNSKIIQILRTFSKDEMKLLGNFVQSPFFNSSKIMLSMYRTLRKRYPGFQEKMIDKRKIFQELHEGKKFNEQIYKNNSSEFLKLLKKFLVQLGLKSDGDIQTRLILNQYNTRFIDSLFKSAMSTYKKELDLKNNVDELYFDKRFFVEQETVQFGLSRNKQHEISENVVNRAGYQILHLYIWLLKSLSEIKTNEFIFNAVYEPNLPKEFFAQIEKFDILKHSKRLPGFEKSIFEIFYFGVLASYFDDNDEYYYKFKQLFLENINKFRFEMSFNFLVRLETSCIHRTQKNKDFSRELFNIYKLKLKHNMYKFRPGPSFSIINFRNMLVVSLNLNEIKWAQDFVERYYKELPPEHRQWMYNFSLAKISFEKKDYDKTFQYLNKINLKEFAFKFDLRSLQIKLFYEVNNIDGVLHEIETYRQFLYKNKNVSEERRTSFLNFLSLVNELIKIENARSLADLRYKAANTNPLNDRDWLLKKTDSFAL